MDGILLSGVCPACPLSLCGIKRIENVLEKMLREQDYQLATLTGVHTVTACALIAHIRDITRFRNANKQASYAGVTPICFSSAGKDKDTSIIEYYEKVSEHYLHKDPKRGDYWYGIK